MGSFWFFHAECSRTSASTRSHGMLHMLPQEPSRLLTAASKILKAKSWAPGKVCALLHMGNNKKYVSFDFHAFILCTAQGQEDQGGVGEKGYVMPYSLPVHELLSQGCAIGQGMAFNLPGLNRVSDLVRVCPNYKQGITRLHIQVRVNSQTKGLERG